MAEEDKVSDNIYSANDAFDINELASLNDDISTEFIEQLQNQLSQKSGISKDGAMFEEVDGISPKTNDTAPVRINIDENIDDNFIKKYKAKLNKQEAMANLTAEDEVKHPEPKDKPEELPVEQVKNSKSPRKKSDTKVDPKEDEVNKIENLSSGNIIEKPLVKEQIEYNDSLDYLDNNTKYSKYVIYIDPENTEFIESLTVKERKNLINKILREQDSIITTKNRFNTFKSVVKHTIVAVITIAISLPILYFLVNASLETTITNYQRSKSNFKMLYKEKGKIQKRSH